MAKNQCGIEVKGGRLGDIKIVANQGRHPAANANYFSFRAQLPCGEEVAFLFTAWDLARARERAQRNPEDVPRVPFILNILD